MTRDQLTVGVHRVRLIEDGAPKAVNLSVIQLHEALGVATYESGTRVPMRKYHFKVNDNVLKWLEKLELLPLAQ